MVTICQNAFSVTTSSFSTTDPIDNSFLSFQNCPLLNYLFISSDFQLFPHSHFCYFINHCYFYFDSENLVIMFDYLIISNLDQGSDQRQQYNLIHGTKRAYMTNILCLSCLSEQYYIKHSLLTNVSTFYGKTTNNWGRICFNLYEMTAHIYQFQLLKSQISCEISTRVIWLSLLKTPRC